METLWNVLTGPKVYAYLRAQDSEFPCNFAERLGESVLTFGSCCRTLCIFFSPILLLVFAAPVDFLAVRKERKHFSMAIHNSSSSSNSVYSVVRDVLAQTIANTFARGLIYPGSLSVLNYIILNVQISGRKKLVVEKNGIRGVLVTHEGNRVDTMLVDRRSKSENGEILVIACEGNAGYYETGIMLTPISLGYSVLGWNQPGFGESGGTPMPAQILSSVDAVMQYAVRKLGFKEEQIVIFAWSIGGFPATWLAANFAGIKGLILDATFDDLLPLAESKMPPSWKSLVQYLIRNYFDLPIGKQLAAYDGPVKLIRRTEDEMIITNESGTEAERLATNRGNYLLKCLIKARHPALINENLDTYVDTWLASSQHQRQHLQLMFASISRGRHEQQQIARIQALCEHYLVDFDANHNTPLNSSLFTLPEALPS